MALRAALYWGGIQSVLRLVLSFVSIKITAVYLGAPGLALVGQLSNFLGLVQGGVGNAIQTGVVKLTAESDGDPNRQARIWHSALKLAFVLGILMGVVTMIMAMPISVWLFDTHEYWPVIVLAGPCLVLGILGAVLSGVLNGLKRMQDLSISQMFAIAIGAMSFIPLAWVFGVWGGLAGTALAVAGAFVAVLPSVKRISVFRQLDWRGHWDPGLVKEIARFYPALLANAAVAPFALILVRNVLAGGVGLHEAGFWQAAWRVSDMYTLVLTTALSLYLMPHLSSCRTDEEFSRELFAITGKVAVLTAVAAAGLYLLRDVVVSVVFTREFEPVRDLMGWQLVGDVFRMATWPLRMALVIKHRTVWYIVAESATPLMHAAFTHMLLNQFGTNAATLGYALSCAITVAILLVALADYLNIHRSSRNHKSSET